MSWKLGRTRQCEKCPWRVDVDPRDILGGYSEELHENLGGTIVQFGEFKGGEVRGIRAMACHETPPGKEAHCIGWLLNQLGPGNNIPLRLHVRTCENIREAKTVGEQHENFYDTLPTTITE